jgi:cell division septation protein DedD
MSISLVALTLQGCASSEEIQEEMSPPAAGVEQKNPDVEFEMKTDTVEAVRHGDQASATTDSASSRIRYAVQIGAFKDPQNATILQAKSRERFTFPVLNEGGIVSNPSRLL